MLARGFTAVLRVRIHGERHDLGLGSAALVRLAEAREEASACEARASGPRSLGGAPKGAVGSSDSDV